MKDKLAKTANWINDNIVGSVWTYIIAIVVVILVDAAIPLQGYQKWNTTTGLFFNTQSSSFELITGIGAVVGVVSLHKKNKVHQKSMDELHKKVDALGKKK